MVENQGAQNGDQLGQEIANLLRTLVRLIGVNAKIEVKNTGNEHYANIRSRSANGLLIGRKGKTIKALQFLVRLIIKRSHPEAPRITVDVSGYQRRRENFLKKKTLAIAKIVLETRREMALDTLTEKEGRIVKEALENIKGVRLYTLGSGAKKNVILAPE